TNTARAAVITRRTMPERLPCVLRLPRRACPDAGHSGWAGSAGRATRILLLGCRTSSFDPTGHMKHGQPQSAYPMRTFSQSRAPGPALLSHVASSRANEPALVRTQRPPVRLSFRTSAGPSKHNVRRARRSCHGIGAAKLSGDNPSGRIEMSDDSAIQRTLVLLKPDAVARGLTGRILARFEDALLKLVAAKMVWMDAELTRQHYFDLEERFGADVYNSMA